MRVILHIGASKCGSSALQTALTEHPHIIRNDGNLIEYVAINGSGGLVRGQDLLDTSGVYGYRSSPNAEKFAKLNLEPLSRSIKSIENDIILSSEGWIFQPSALKKLFVRNNMSVEPILYIRPHVPLLNSAWWQWGAWSGETFSDWMSHRLRASMWSKRVTKWQEIHRVNKVKIRLLPKDIVSDFFGNILNADVPTNIKSARFSGDHATAGATASGVKRVFDRICGRSEVDRRHHSGLANPIDDVSRGQSEAVNKSLPGPVLRLFQRNRQLRDNLHASSIDFILSKYMDSSEGTPWVLDQTWIDRILEETREDNLRLLAMMDTATADAMRADPRWWDASSYSEKMAESPDPVPLSTDTLETMCVDLVKAINVLARKK